jgi:hypothetical protein
MKTRALRKNKPQQPYLMGEIHTFTCDSRPKTKLPTLSCITDNRTRTTHIPVASTLAQQPSNKGRKHVIFREPDQATTPAAHTSNLNTSQQDADIKEIQQQIKNCEIKANRQVATCHKPKCLACSENKDKKRSHKQHRGSITQDDNHPGSNILIDHLDAANVPGYTWQYNERPTLNKYKNFMLFVDHKTRLVYPSFQELKTASEACRSKCDYDKFAQGYQATVKSYHADNGAFRSKTFQKAIDNKNQQLNFSGVSPVKKCPS